MFLISLLIFPILSYFIFEKYKKDISNLNGIIKIIGSIGLFILVFLLFKDIFRSNEKYIFLLIVWYIIVFFYYYINSFLIQFKNIDKIFVKPLIIKDGLIKILYIFLLFIFLAQFFRYTFNSFINDNFFIIYAIFLAYYGIFFEILDIFKNTFFRNRISNINFKEQLKQEIKIEILNDLKNNK